MMLSTANLLSPADGSPVVAPTQDMVLGCYYLTMEPPTAHKAKAERRLFAIEDEAILAYQLRTVTLHEPVWAEVRTWDPETESLVPMGRETTVGRIIFNQILPPQLRVQQRHHEALRAQGAVDVCYRLLGPEETAHLVDGIKSVGLRVRDARRHDHRRQRHRDAGRQGRAPCRGRRPGRPDRPPVPARPHHRRRALRAGRRRLAEDHRARCPTR